MADLDITAFLKQLDQLRLKPVALSQNLPELNATFQKLISLAENFLGPSVTRESPSLEKIDSKKLNSLLAEMELINNPAVALAFKIALKGTWDLSRNLPLTSVLPGHPNPEECYKAAFGFINTEAEKAEIKDRLLVEGDLPPASGWFKAFKDSVDNAIEVNRNSLANSGLPTPRETPRVSILYGDSGKKSSLGIIDIVPIGAISLNNSGLLDRILLNNNVSVGTLLTSFYGRKIEEDKSAPLVEKFSVALPVRPEDRTAEFLVQLYRKEDVQRVLIITGDGKLSTFQLMRRNDPRISDENNKESTFCGAPNLINPNQESPFEAVETTVLTDERKNLLLHQLGLSESTSITFILIPMVAMPSIPTYNEQSLTMSATRGGGLHTSVGGGYSGGQYLSSNEKLIVNTLKMPRIIQLNTVGL